MKTTAHYPWVLLRTTRHMTKPNVQVLGGPEGYETDEMWLDPLHVLSRLNNHTPLFYTSTMVAQGAAIRLRKSGYPTAVAVPLQKLCSALRNSLNGIGCQTLSAFQEDCLPPDPKMLALLETALGRSLKLASAPAPKPEPDIYQPDAPASAPPVVKQPEPADDLGLSPVPESQTPTPPPSRPNLQTTKTTVCSACGFERPALGRCTNCG